MQPSAAVAVAGRARSRSRNAGARPSLLPRPPVAPARANDSSGRASTAAQVGWRLNASHLLALERVALEKMVANADITVTVEPPSAREVPLQSHEDGRRVGSDLTCMVKMNEATIQVDVSGAKTRRRIDPLLGDRAVTYNQFLLAHAADEMPVGPSYWETLRVEDTFLDIQSTVFDLIGTVLTRWGVYEIASAPIRSQRIVKLTGVFSPPSSPPLAAHVAAPEVRDVIRQFQHTRTGLQIAHGSSGVVSNSLGPRSVNCFGPNTAFRTHGGLIPIADLDVGQRVMLKNGLSASVVHMEAHERATRSIVELIANQASLKVSDNHRVEVVDGPNRTRTCAARDLRVGDHILVGARARPLAAVRHLREMVVLADVRFDPDEVVEAFVIPNYGIQVRGAQPPLDLMATFQNVSLEELMEATPSVYSD